MMRALLAAVAAHSATADVRAALRGGPNASHRRLEAPDSLGECLKAPGGSPHTYVGSAEYETSGGVNLKDVHNARVTSSIQPSAVVFATEEAHVVRAVSCAFKFGKPVYGRSGMNQYEASCAGTGAGCVVVDVNNMWEVGWPSAGCQQGQSGCVASLGPGLSLGSAYSELSKRGYTIPAGTCAQVRVAGLTLGGGKGWLTRKYGLLIDTLRAVDVVLLNGTKVRADAHTEPHLFWLARGGGGNSFPGVATAFHFELVPMPASPATYHLEWSNPSQECRKSVPALWYEKLAMHPDNDFFARIEFSNFGGAKAAISVTYVGEDKSSAEELLREVGASSACGSGKLSSKPDITWMGIVLGANGGDETIEAPGNNNCGWDLSGPTPRRTPCQGWDTDYNLQWAYRSLVTGAGGHVPQGVWDALAKEEMYDNYYVEIDPSNGFAGTVAADATAYPHRDAGFVTLQYVMRGSAAHPDISDYIQQSAETMRAVTAHVPRLGYYNYLDKSMHQYSGVPRDAYYGSNADNVEAYVRKYTEGLGLNGGCSRCDSWELARA
jgi:FAD/FMN-containing dehydrogenase